MEQSRYIKPFRQSNHYEVLEVPPDALPLEIRRAYKKAFALYGDDSLASYSFFSEAEREEILACIEQAYLILINDEARAAYDRSLVALGVLEEGQRYRDRAKEPVAIYNLRTNCGDGPSPGKRADKLKSMASQSSVIQDILAQDTLATSDLQKLREGLEMTLEEIADRTNIRVDILRAIEEEKVDILPPAVYLKGFLKAYFRCLELDEQAAVNAYLEKVGKHGLLSP